MRLRRLVPAGLADAGFSALATFAVGVYAARLDPTILGAYALYFAALRLLQSVPGQLIFVPIEVDSVAYAPSQRLHLMRPALRIGLPISLASGLLVAGTHLLLPGGVGWNVSGPLMITTAAATATYPIQEHVRRMLHLAGESWKASTVSGAQFVIAAGAVLLLPALGVEPIWVPMGALAIANALSSGIGFFVGQHGGEASAIERFRFGELSRSGGWLLASSTIRNGAGLIAGALIAALASIDQLGYAEAARVLGQPLLVLATGLGLVLRPRSMEAAKAKNLRDARRISGLSTALLTGTGLTAVILLGIPWSWSPLPNLLPNAYVVVGLLAARLGANVISGMAFPYRFEMLGARKEARLAQVDTASGIAQVGVAFTAPFTQAFAHPLGVLTVSVGQLFGYRRHLGRHYRRRRTHVGRVLHLAQGALGEGGGPHNLRSLAAAQAERGMNVTIAGFGRPDLPTSDMPDLIRVETLPHRRWRRVVRRLADTHDVVHVHGLMNWHHAGFVRSALAAGAVAITTPRSSHHPAIYGRRFGRDGIAPLHNLAKRLFTALIDRPVLRSVHGIHVLSPFEAEFEAARGVPLWVHPYGIDPEPTTSEPAANSTTTFLFVGRLDLYQKGLDLLIDAFRQTVANSSQASLVIAGPGDPGVLDLDGLSNVAVLGPIDHDKRRDLMARADFFVHPSRWEVMARAARESLCAGLPLIATRESNFGDWVAEYDMGIVTAATSKGIAVALQEAMATDEARRSTLRQNALRFAAKHPWSRLAEQLERRYNEVME